jgi:flagellar biosynthesis protein FlhF
MKIKRYTAPSMRAALALVRAEQGPDAVILSSRRGEEGIEVIAAVDYDEGLFVDLNRQRTATVAATVAVPLGDPADARVAPAPAAPPATPRSAAAPKPAGVPKTVTALKPAEVPRAVAAVKPLAAPAPAPAAAAAAAPRSATGSSNARAPTAAVRAPARPDLGYVAMQRELQDLRHIVETGLAGMTWNDKRLREPLKARVLEELSALDIAPDVALTLAALAPPSTSLQDPSHIPPALLLRHLPIVEDLSSVSGIMAIVGPTGAGKTTTIAKLAARWCLRHRSQDLALISTDGYRIGARDQLMTYARILGAPMYAANNGRDLARLLERLKTKKLVLIDTPGMGPRDIRLGEQLAVLKTGAPRARVLLALPAPGEAHALDDIVRAFAGLKPVASILTKVDEAVSLGAVISTSFRHRLKIAYVCDGQRVPEDLHAASRKRVWLVSSALGLKDLKAPARDQAYFVRNFGRANAHA